jgi:Tfp pilus assembly protein PilO
MKTDLKSYVADKAALEQSQRQLSKTDGAIDQLLKQLEDELGHQPAAKELDGLIADLKRKLKGIEENYGKALAKFEKKWAKQLENME